MIDSIKDVLMKRDGMSASEAEELILEAKEQLQYYLEDGDLEEAENICQDYFGLEPDYLVQLL